MYHCDTHLASLPGHSHLQFMSVCIMPVLKAVKIYEVGMAWEQGKFCSVPGYDCSTMSN